VVFEDDVIVVVGGPAGRVVLHRNDGDGVGGAAVRSSSRILTSASGRRRRPDFRFSGRRRTPRADASSCSPIPMAARSSSPDEPLDRADPELRSSNQRVGQRWPVARMRESPEVGGRRRGSHVHSHCVIGAGFSEARIAAAMRGSRYMMDWPAARTELDDLRAQKLTANARSRWADVPRSHDHSFVCIPPWLRHQPTQNSLVVFQRAYRRIGTRGTRLSRMFGCVHNDRFSAATGQSPAAIEVKGSADRAAGTTHNW
jgi:hypothetical protein